MYLRQNIVQAVIGEILGVSQPTVSRAIKAITAAISRTLAVLLLTAEEVPEVVDGTLLPCPDWRRRRDPWSVKHGRAGMNVQILVRPNGGFVWAPGPLSGVYARRGRTGRLRIAGGNRSLRMDRRQGLYRQGGDHTAQEAPKENSTRRRRRRTGASTGSARSSSAPSPTSSPGESFTHPTGGPWKHSSRPSPQHSHSIPSRPPPE